MKPAFLLVVASALFLLLPPKSVIAKNASIGIYAIVDHVTFEPDAGPPNSVRIFGVFVVPVRLSSGNYHSPQKGYLYFRLAPGTEQATRRDWSELTTVAGSGKVVGFGQYWVPNPNDPHGNPHTSLEVRVHAEGDVATPDVYPLPQQGGVTEVKAGNMDRDPHSDEIAAQLLAALAVGRNNSSFNVRLTADSQQREGSLLRCRGNVEMATNSIVLRADEVDYHSDSGLAEARGNVRIQLLPVAPSTASAGKM
jgi:hypothetical protein